MKVNIVILTVLLLFGAACAADGGTEPAVETPAVETDLPAAETSVPVPETPAGPTEETPMEDDSPTTPPTESEGTPFVPEQAATKQSSEPVTVDLGQLTPVPTSDSDPVEAPAPGNPNPENALQQQVLDDLSGRLSIDPSAITVVSFQAVTWRDGSLGCPQPGMFYTQALVEGYQIILNANGTDYHYHTRGDSSFFLCTNPSTNEPAAGEPDPNS